VVQKYIESIPLETWIRSPQKSLKGASVIWKAVINAFPVIENGLAWKIGNGNILDWGQTLGRDVKDNTYSPTNSSII
jgi:hypothetical protein